MDVALGVLESVAVTDEDNLVEGVRFGDVGETVRVNDGAGVVEGAWVTLGDNDWPVDRVGRIKGVVEGLSWGYRCSKG